MKFILMFVSIFVLLISLFFGPLSFGTRPLSDTETSIAEPIFQNSLDLTKVRIKTGGSLTLIYPGVTIGNTVSFPVGAYDVDSIADQALLLHELTHVWQYQNDGWSYLFRALYEEVFEPNAYEINYDPDMSFFDYDVEEQCEIVAEYYISGGKLYGSYINEMRLGE